MNDYPKFGVWPDGYYLAFNQFAAGSGNWAGQGVAVFERSRMLAGTADARMLYIDMASDGSLGGMLPSDLDGTAPPAGAPNVFMQFDDTPDQLQIWEFRTNWSVPSASFSKVGNFATAAFDPNLCNYSRNCIPQPSRLAKLDAISGSLDVQASVQEPGGSRGVGRESHGGRGLGPGGGALVRGAEGRRGLLAVSAGHVLAGFDQPVDGQRRDGRRG